MSGEVFQREAGPVYGVIALCHYQTVREAHGLRWFLLFGILWSETKRSLLALLWQKTPFSPKLISTSSGVTQLDHISQSPLQEGVSNVAKFYPMKYGGEVMNATSRLGP